MEAGQEGRRADVVWFVSRSRGSFLANPLKRKSMRYLYFK